ncbi:hypothetical protein [Peptostreptococcus canis]|uniref:Uncharacterized protein n=1 Tax=Peptostreptococcus canis TaxID=1159213 RepID=A0ABR6TKJ5_9FIRM|nr:hypothetical protein [Peptostreptococcus canis]MBC2575926.1 hypothetical protein [Peptostreptococcus canis]MBP1997953.1 hypothetical protein [Peptostreptococcus canis]
MFKLGEKVIFNMKSGYSLTGLDNFSLDDKCLQLTNLGNIYVSKVDYLGKDIEEYLVYEHKDCTGILNSEIDLDGINIFTDSLNFKFVRGEFETELDLSLIMILDLEEFIHIKDILGDSIFNFINDNIILKMDDSSPIIGNIEKAQNRFLFNSGRYRYEFILSDIESYRLLDNGVEIRGYFYVDKESKVFRRVEFTGHNIDKFIPENIDEIVNSNKKIGRIPNDDIIAFCKVSGTIREKEYLLKSMFIIRHDDLLVLYEKKEKKEILCEDCSNFSKIDFKNGNYIIFDELNVFNLYIDEENSRKIGLNKINNISGGIVGFTKEKRPFFIDIDDKAINLYKSREKKILTIDKSTISNISIHEESESCLESYVETEIRFKDKFIRIILKRNVAKELSENIFSEYQNSLLNTASIQEVYENWIKSISDMVIYNFFGHIYDMDVVHKKIDKNSSLNDLVDVINELYNEIHIQMENIDCISVNMSEILYNIERRYFRSVGIEVDLQEIEKLEKFFFEIRNNIKIDLTDIAHCIENISYMLLPSSMRKSSIRMLKESEVYRVDLFSRQAHKKLKHLIYNMLPHYIAKTIIKIFDTYKLIYKYYETIDEIEVKEELMERIKSAHIFRQFTTNNNSTVLRKDIIDDLYSITKFGSMKVDSEFYYTGGYR